MKTNYKSTLFVLPTPIYICNTACVAQFVKASDTQAVGLPRTLVQVSSAPLHI